MTQPILNYEQITKLLEIFFKNYGYKPSTPSSLITNLTFNYGLNFEERDVLDNTYVVQKCGRVEDIKKADTLCTLPLFHMFVCSDTLSLDGLTQFMQYVINTFQLDVSNIYLETSYSFVDVVNEFESKCGIKNVLYVKENIALILNNGVGSLISPYGSSIGKIRGAMSINYRINANTQIEIAQITETRKDNIKTYCIGVGIERLYTTINYYVKDVFIPNWYNTIPLFIIEVKKESLQTGVALPIGYELIVNTDPKDIIVCT